MAEFNKKKSHTPLSPLKRVADRRTAIEPMAEVPLKGIDMDWPLLGAKSSRKPQATVPELSSQEIQARQSAGKSGRSVAKPTLSVPGVSQKLARGLAKFTSRIQSESAVAANRQNAETHLPHFEAARETIKDEMPPIPEFKSSRKTRTPAALEASTAEETTPMVPRGRDFSHPEAGSQAVSRAVPDDAPEQQEDSIEGLFARLARKPQATEAPVKAVRATLPARQKKT